MRKFRLLVLFMLMPFCLLIANGAQAQASPPDLRRAPISAPVSPTLAPAEAPVQLFPPCADTTVIYEAADTIRGVRPPRLVRFAYASLGQQTLWHADFVVGTNGAPEHASIVMTRNGEPTGNAHFRDQVEGLRYQPAAVGGCAVRFKTGMDMQMGGG